MQGILLILSGLGWTLDLLLLVLDLHYWLVSSLLSYLLWTINFILKLPGTITFGLLQFWECVLICMGIMGESCCSLVLYVVQLAGDAVRGVLTGLDSLHLVWNLMCHLLIRSKEIMQRGLLHIAIPGQNLFRQVWEALSITCSLAAYLVNSLVNMCLIGMQHIFSSALALWISTVNVIFTGKELIIALFSELSSSAVAVVILFWTPFQLFVDVMVSCSTGIGTILFRYLYEVLLLMLLVWASRLIHRPSPLLLLFQERLSRLYRILLVFVRALLNSEVWRRAAARFLRLVRMHRVAWDRDWNLRRTVARNTPLRVARAQNSERPTQVLNPLPVRRQNPSMQSSSALNPVPNRVQIPQQVLGGPQSSASTSTRGETGTVDPWKLLKQQEESKKCVICQDENKTVLLLPCRHLCLCAHCTNILLQQPILQRNCPLCRKMVLQTLNVYM
ncbi:E3 ubiquitin-protein ligase RNF26 [Pseudophryne corroboree]|uniref:E3 ubiquitin-protein ligase RNF26 n=1 Tax=Pseudophryne corroboree TaxID=495146 RepID=UPI0030816561